MIKLILFVITLTILFNISNGQPCPCLNNNNILQCSVTSFLSTVNTNGCNSNNYNLIDIFYTGSVVLRLTSPSTQTIVIKPSGGSSNNVLQISSINTNASLIYIQLTLSSNQASTILIPASSSINAPNANLSINVMQTIADASTFQVFDTSSSPTQTNFVNYILVFNTTSTSSGNLNLPNLIYGLQNLTSIIISGNNHTLLVDKTKMPPTINVNQLSLKNLILYDQILINFYNLQTYSIQACQYNRSSLFLNSNQPYNLTLIMVNNIPLNSILPFPGYTFTKLGAITNLYLIEPLLNSSFLKDIQRLSYPSRLVINLGEYYQSDMIAWAAVKPVIWFLMIQNIKDLSIFPSLFFNNFQATNHVTLQGSFDLEKSDICIFVGISIQIYATYPIVIIDSSTNDTANNCAETYITAINTRSISSITCPPADTNANCQQWADETNECDLVTYENACPGTVQRYGKNFFYNNSYLYNFFAQNSWLNRTGSTTGSHISQEGSLNIAAIIGAICGLIAAIAILTLTIFCIHRHREKSATKYISSTPAEKNKPSSHDPTHVSIATSKSSKSSRYALEQSFFPGIYPTDEIAPPLYTAPSESVGSISAYHLPSAPPAPRDSISTHATHVYETLDP